MRGMKRYSWLPVCAIVLLMLPSAALGGDSIILFSSDRDADQEIYDTKNHGEVPPNAAAIQVTDESPSEAHNPSFTPSGRFFIFDVGGALYMSDIASPVQTSVYLRSGTDPDAGPYINTDRDFRIIFQIGIGGTMEIWMATYDAVEEEIVNVVELTEDSNSDQTQPAFCGDDHFVWKEEDSYGGRICYQEFDDDGPVGDDDCRYGGFGDRKDEHPSCDSEGLFITWARESTAYEGRHDIWIMDADDGANAERIALSSFDETMPVWKPGGTDIAYTKKQDNEYYEIYRMQDDGSGQGELTNNDYDDIAPSWAP